MSDDLHERSVKQVEDLFRRAWKPLLQSVAFLAVALMAATALFACLASEPWFAALAPIFHSMIGGLWASVAVSTSRSAYLLWQANQHPERYNPQPLASWGGYAVGGVLTAIAAVAIDYCLG